MKKSEEKKDKKLIEVINIALDKIKNKYLQ